MTKPADYCVVARDDDTEKVVFVSSSMSKEDACALKEKIDGGEVVSASTGRDLKATMT